MLTCLRVRNLAIVEALEVELGPGLNVVTGETGAGKSILVDALELVLGARGRPDVVRTGEKSAEVEALFDVAAGAALGARLEAAGLEAQDELVVRRVVQAAGRTRAYVNGRLATATQLGELAEGLADICSQHEHHSLVEPARHLELLDAFAQLGGKRGEIARAHGELNEAAQEVDRFQELGARRVEREDLLRYQVREITEIDPQPGEEEQLSAERDRLRHAEQLLSAAGGAESRLYADDDAVCATVGRIAGEVREAAAIDAALGTVADQLDEARAQIEDAARELGKYSSDVTVDPARLTEVEDRLDDLRRLARKYGGSIETALEHHARAQEELDSLTRHDDKLAALEQARDEALAQASTVAKALSAARRKGAKKLGAAISSELSSLGMGDARVEVEVARLEGGDGIQVDGARLSPTGIDRAELLIAPNRGEDARPLRKIASGGELSRSMLAIKRVLAGLQSGGLYVFDEVDAGVGGAVAEVIGQKLRDVAAHHQVLCVTHLPQIAVYADAHFRVSKDVQDGRTRSTVRRLEDAERREEIARMLGGVKVSQKTRAVASEMLRDAGAR